MDVYEKDLKRGNEKSKHMLIINCWIQRLKIFKPFIIVLIVALDRNN